MKEVRFGDRRIGDGQPAFVIAEAGVNHNGDLELGRSLIREAQRAGAGQQSQGVFFRVARLQEHRHQQAA